jgi:hypothetical protein
MSDLTGIGSIFDFGGKLIDRIWPDPTEAAKAKLKMFEAQQAGELQELSATWDNAKAQLAVNQVEAASESLFVSGWRPAIGWICGVAFAYKFIVAPFLAFLLVVFGHKVAPPEIDFAEMLPVLFGLLGLGGMRTWEKVKGASSTKG